MNPTGVWLMVSSYFWIWNLDLKLFSKVRFQDLLGLWDTIQAHWYDLLGRFELEQENWNRFVGNLF